MICLAETMGWPQTRRPPILEAGGMCGVNCLGVTEPIKDYMPSMLGGVRGGGKMLRNEED